MSETPFTNREIEKFFQETNKHLVEIKDEHLARIEEQVRKTNGRVGKLENWRAFITGGLAILTLLVVPILLNIFGKL